MAHKVNMGGNQWIFQKSGDFACKNAINFNNESLVPTEEHKIVLFEFMVKACAQAACQ